MTLGAVDAPASADSILTTSPSDLLPTRRRTSGTTEVITTVLNTHGTIGIDIGGTLAKLALAIPDGVDPPKLPEKFGFSGVADKRLRMHVTSPHPMAIIFLQVGLGGLCSIN